MTRAIATIVADIDAALRSETSSAVQVGALLIEAKKQIGHGGWIDWLDSNFAFSIKTAENYMTAAKFALKFEIVSNLKNLKLPLTTIYKMARDKSLFTDEAVKAVFKRAEAQWIDDMTAVDIALDLIPSSPDCDEAAYAACEAADSAEAEAEAEAEAAAILDGAPPDLPESPPPSPVNFDLQSFEHAIKSLLALQTKPMNSFVATKFAPEQLISVIKFLEQIASRKTKRAA